MQGNHLRLREQLLALDAWALGDESPVLITAPFSTVAVI